MAGVPRAGAVKSPSAGSTPWASVGVMRSVGNISSGDGCGGARRGDGCTIDAPRRRPPPDGGGGAERVFACVRNSSGVASGMAVSRNFSWIAGLYSSSSPSIPSSSSSGLRPMLSRPPEESLRWSW